MAYSLRSIHRCAEFQGAVLPLVVVALWQVLSLQGHAYAYAFVSVIEIWRSLVDLISDGELPTNALASAQTTVSGIVLGGLAGLAVGGLMGMIRIVDRVIGPLYHAVRQVPLLGWIPLIGLWFGSGSLAKVLVVSLAAFYPVVLNTYEGICNVERRYLEVAQVFNFSRWQQFIHVLLPAALPSVMTGLMQSLSFAWIATVGSELLFTSGPGLGTLMQTAQAASRMDVVILCVASIGVTGFLMNHGFVRLGRRLLQWRG